MKKQGTKKKTASKKTPPKKVTKNTKKPVAEKSATGKKSKNQAKNGKERVEAAYPHFRDYKKSRHPALIVGEQKRLKQTKEGEAKPVEEYKFRKVMHGDKDGRHLNETIFPNPNPKDPNPMHIAKRVRIDEKKFFGKKPKSWKYPKEDKKK